MAARIQDIRARLIQVRRDPEMLFQEQQCFLERCRLGSAQLKATNVLTDSLTPSLLEDIDVLFIGGAGAFSVTQTYSWTDDLIALILRVGEIGLPLFGSCWGHQLIGRAFGGVVIEDQTRVELGCFPVELTPAGREDRLFRGFPPVFKANMGHQDRISVLPPRAVELATSAVAPIQALRIKGVPIYGTQFHSELDAHRERERLFFYRDHYASISEDDALQRAIDSLEATTEVDHLMYDFLQRFVLQTESRPAAEPET